jgi:hypothetical protein
LTPCSLVSPFLTSDLVILFFAFHAPFQGDFVSVSLPRPEGVG